MGHFSRFGAHLPPGHVSRFDPKVPHFYSRKDPPPVFEYELLVGALK